MVPYADPAHLKQLLDVAISNVEVINNRFFSLRKKKLFKCTSVERERESRYVCMFVCIHAFVREGGGHLDELVHM